MKRIFDLVIICFGIIFFLPMISVIAILVRFKIGSPIFFNQPRAGLEGKAFKIYKFRTMTNETDSNGVLLQDSERLNQFGKFLRSTSLDELPSLWNVLIGDMSLVGPRPLLVEYLPLYSERQSRRHKAKPGISGWAQVNGRNNISWDAKFELDVWYVDNQSFLLDVKILWLTVKKVIARDGVTAQGDATMPIFRGSKK